MWYQVREKVNGNGIRAKKRAETKNKSADKLTSVLLNLEQSVDSGEKRKP